ncbi:MAG TPA: type IX secretion system membrane protein PorP/SprF [Flavobacterium sp.]|nr:type IX secretion system membrane protein PorP/SprF [Flavobacterium sp.]
MKKILFTAFVVLLTFIDAQGQQEPQYTQYMYNLNVINPAYAGFKENLSFGLLYRKQWVDIQDAPTTMTFSGSSPVGKNVGLGLNVISDKIGPSETTNLNADFSYGLNLGGGHRLAFGLKAGATFLDLSLLDINNSLPDANDPAFSENISETYFGLGAGLFYSADKYYISFSIPNMLNTPYYESNNIEYGQTAMHYYLSGGYVFDLNPNLKFKPTVMLHSAFDAPLSLDLTANFLINERLELGAAYRIEDSVDFMINYAITPNLKIGYAYDYLLSDLNVTTNSSHEVVLLFDLNFPKKVSQSPRFF